MDNDEEEKFALVALQGLLAGGVKATPEKVAELAVKHAQALASALYEARHVRALKLEVAREKNQKRMRDEQDVREMKRIFGEEKVDAS